jgi:hypothetical protein
MSNVILLQLVYWQSDALTTRLELIRVNTATKTATVLDSMPDPAAQWNMRVEQNTDHIICPAVQD